MDKIDTKLMIHVGAEVVIIGGLSFYFSRQIKGLTERIENLEKQNEMYRNAIETHEAYLRDLFESGAIRRHPRQQKPPQKVPPKAKKQVPIPQNDEDSELEFDDEALDAELGPEFQELEECENESCGLKDSHKK